MTRPSRTSWPLALALSVVWGCESTTEGLTDEEIEGTLAEAIAEMEDAMYAAVHIESVSDLDDVSFEDARALFADVLEADPEDEVRDIASLGFALTTIFAMEDDPDVRAIADSLEAMDDDLDPSLIPMLLGTASVVQLAPGTLPLDFSTDGFRRVANAGLAPLTAPVGPVFAEAPEVEEVLDVLAEVVRPALIEALDALAVIEDPAFAFEVTPRMQGEDEDSGNSLELDLTEVFAIRTGLSVAVAAIHVATAYVLEPDPIDGGQALVDALTPGSTFLTLGVGGEANLGDAHDRLLDATDFLLAGLAHLETETDDQDDDIIKYDPSGTGSGVTAQDIADAEEIVGEVQDALTGTTEVTIGSGEDEVVVSVDLSEFFLDPIEDFKELLPDYEVFLATENGTEVALLRWEALNLGEWVIPDPSISGILPEMVTQADLMETFPLEGVFVGASVAGGRYELLTIDGTDCFATVTFGGMGSEWGCLVGADYFYSAEIELEGRDGQPRVEFSAWGEGAFLQHSGSYTVAPSSGNAYLVDITPDSGPAFDVTATLLDLPGFVEYDGWGRSRGGSRISFTYLGSVWVFERQY